MIYKYKVQLKMFQLFLYENLHLLSSSGRYNGIRERINNFFLLQYNRQLLLCYVNLFLPRVIIYFVVFSLQNFHGDKMHKIQQTEISDATRRKA